MHTRRFGRTNLQMPVFSTGGMRYQDGWKDKPLSEVDPEKHANLVNTIQRSLDVGINHIETARGYGCSERELGVVLPKYPREDLIVQTKVGPNDDPQAFYDNFYDSLDRLQLDHVDLFSIHGINNQETLEQAIRPGGCFDMAQRIREEGKCKFVGFSTHGSLDIILEAIRFGEPEVGKGFDYLNLHYYWIFQRNRPAIDEAMKRDMGVFIISPSDKGGKLYSPPAKLVELCKPLHPMVFNDLWTLSQPGVHTLSLGAAKPSDYDEHLEADRLLDEVETILPPIVERLRDEMERVTGHPDHAHLTEDLPWWDETPGELNLELIFLIRNLAKAWDMIEYGKMRFNMMGGGGHWVPGSKVDEAFANVDKQALREKLNGHPAEPHVENFIIETINLVGGKEIKRLSEND